VKPGRRATLARAAWLGLIAPMACASPAPPLAAASPSPPPTVAPAPSASAAQAVAAPAPPDESFRSQPPAPTSSERFVPPRAKMQKLRNGIAVVLVDEPSPFETIVVVARGPAEPGAGTDVRETMLAPMLRGTPRYKLSTLLDRYAQALMPEPAWTAWIKDATLLSATFPTEKLDLAVGTLAEEVIHPEFERKTFERAREQRARSLDTAPLDPGYVAGTVIGRALFGATPYGDLVTAKGVRAVKREDVVALHDRLFEPSRLTLVAAGGVAEEKVMAALDLAFGAMPAPAKPPAPDPVPSVKLVAGPRLVVVDRPGATVSAIVGAAIAPGAADDMPTAMANDILTNNAVGRASARLRDDLKLVSRLETYRSTARFASIEGWRTQAPTEQVPKVLTEMDAMIRSFATGGPTVDEVETDRESLRGDFVRAFKTTGDAARAFAARIARGFPLDAVAIEAQKLDEPTGDSIRAAAAKYFDPDRSRVVIVGDLAQLRAPLLALGWGPIEVRDAAGAVLRTERAKEPH
jgi:predicted Zn-dependent peptidase